MNRIHLVCLTIPALAAIAAVAAVHAAFSPAQQSLCYSSAGTTYRIAQDTAAPDFRIRVASNAPRPDLKLALVDHAETADFVLVDDSAGDPPSPCRSAKPVQTVAFGADPATPDVTVSLSTDPAAADYRIYLRSKRFTEQDAAALLAAMWKADQRGDVTGSIPPR